MARLKFRNISFSLSKVLKAKLKPLDLMMADFVYVDKENASQILLASRPQQKSTTTRGMGKCMNYVLYSNGAIKYILFTTFNKNTVEI